jgi:cation diffusion facilitator CzcD-associated flavoprotein CzcO
MLATPPDFDVLIVGAGISGIGMAAHMQMKAPHHSYAIVEQRDNLGGTWDLFRYPGVRSDSDMYTLGYTFEPWREKETLAQRDRIVSYLEGVVDKYGIRPNLQFGRTVVSAGFDSARAMWTITLEDRDGAPHQVTAKWLYLGAGYYNYDAPHDPGFDFSAFEGIVAHPQFWPEDLDYTGKQVVVIGSGATAVTLVPTMAEKANRVTMLQRTPTYLRSIPLTNPLFRFIRAVLPENASHRLLRWINIRVTDTMYKTAKAKPDLVRKRIDREARRILGERYREEDYTPPYNPWDQRMCFMPDADLFEAIKADKAAIVTAHIDGFEAGGVRLADGRLIKADIIVTATGLSLLMAGGVEIAVDGETVIPNQHFYYKNAMISDVPNLTHPVPYVNAGATLRFDLVADYTCRVLEHLRTSGTDIAVPLLGQDHGLVETGSYAVESGYVLRGKDALPKSTDADPWRLNHDYIHDKEYMQTSPIDDGVLMFRTAGANALRCEEKLEAAE